MTLFEHVGERKREPKCKRKPWSLVEHMWIKFARLTLRASDDTFDQLNMCQKERVKEASANPAAFWSTCNAQKRKHRQLQGLANACFLARLSSKRRVRFSRAPQAQAKESSTILGLFAPTIVEVRGKSLSVKFNESENFIFW